MSRHIKCILLCSVVFAIVIPSYAQMVINDTTFLRRKIKRYDSNKINYNAVFIVKQKSSPYYKNVLDYDFKKITSLGNSNPQSQIDTNAMKEIPRKWYPLRKYQGKYYILLQDCIHKVLLTDTAYVNNSMEGVFSEGLNSFRQINTRTFQLNANTWHNKTFTLRIYIIDPGKELAVFESFGTQDQRHSYRLMVGADKIKFYPLIVRISRTKYLPDNKWYEEEPNTFMTEEPDYRSLLNKNKL